MNGLISFIPELIWLAILEARGFGIIYIEEQIVQWICVYNWVLFKYYMPSVIMILAIYFVIMYVVFENRHPFHGAGRHTHRFIGFIFRCLGTLIGAWFFLIFGAVRGNLYDNTGEREATATYNYRRPIGHFWSVSYSFTRLSLHFRLGRGLFRVFFRLVRWICDRMGRQVELQTMIRVARVLALLVILWGVWYIPYDLTH